MTFLLIARYLFARISVKAHAPTSAIIDPVFHADGTVTGREITIRH